MQQWEDHSLRGYLKRQPTYKLELLLRIRKTSHYALTDEDYVFIEDILRTRSDATLFEEDADVGK